MQDGHTRRHFLFGAGAVAAALALPAAAARLEFEPWPSRRAAPALDAKDLAGRTWTLDSLRGRAVLLNFWASWCEPCRAEMPALQQLSDFYGDDKLAVIALNFKETASVAARFASRTGLKVPVLLDPDGGIARRWEVKVFPTTVLIAAEGQPRWRVRGEMDWTSLEAGRVVERLMSERR
jgi:thiol-disulfide isomerase/thioredoxin